MKRIKEFSIYALAVLCLLTSIATAEELTLNINVKKPIAVVSEKFLSITLDPVALFNTDFLSDVEKSTNMARALAPAYVRIGGPRSNVYMFERGLYKQETRPSTSLTFTETHWINLHQWAERSGLDVVACVAPQMSDIARAWDPRNALDLISFSDHMGYNTSWQLGYECQTNCKISGADLGRDVVRLRSMLDAFPRFAETGIVAGPDVVTWRTKQEQQYLQDYFNAAAAALSALTWHPDFAGVSLEEDGVSMHYDNLAAEKDALYKVVGRQVSKKPLWIAESKPEDCKRQFLGALVWARRLGNSAKLGAQVLMRQPESSNFLRPTPDFWVSMLHKMLVGREVLDTKISSGNRTHIHFYTQCTRPSEKYEKGSITIFGINLTPTKIAASLKGLKIKTVHKYVLLPGYDSPNRMFAETVLLNNDLLSLINGKEMPEINPIIYNVDKDMKLKLPSGGIGFWVLPGLKVKSCMGPDDDIGDRNIVRRGNKRLEDLEVEEDLEPADDGSQETPDVADSLEDRKLLLRHQLPRRLTKRRSLRYKDIDRDDERSLRRGDGIKRDVRKHDISESGAYTTSDEKDENFEEAIERKTSDGQSLDSGEEIRAKLQEYKRRLADHEYRKKQRGKAAALTKERASDEPDSTSNKNMDTGKVIEALTLITKVESAMKGFEKNNDTQQYLSNSPKLGSGDFNDVTAGLKKSSKNDELLDEVLNTEKAKRTAIPAKIEEQLKALYQLLSEEKTKKDALPPLRHRRDLDKRVGDDPPGLRRDSTLLRKRAETKEKRNERRQRIRERIEERRRERENIKKVPRETSNENNFYGFQYRAPIKNFPEGDLYVQGTTSTVKRENAVMKPGRTINEHEDVWLEEGDVNHMPNEFYENVKLQGFHPMDYLKEYGELWEAEALQNGNEHEKIINGAAEYATPEIVTERQLTEAEDRKAKEKAVQQLITYYEAAPQQQSYDYEELRQKQLQEQQQQLPQLQQLQTLTQMQLQQPLTQLPLSQQPLPQVQPQHQVYYQQQIPQIPVSYQQAVVAGNNAQQSKYYAGSQGKYSDVSRYYVDPSQYPQQNRRSKRDVSDLENLLHQEMIDEDDNNLKDCQCRVIRGIENCKDCQIKAARQLGTPLLFMPGRIIHKPVLPKYGKKIRVRRDIEEVPAIAVEEGIVPEVIAVIPEGAPGIPETILATPEVDPKVAIEEEIDEVIAPATHEEDAAVQHGAVNVEVTMEASKEDGPEVVLPGPIQLEMHLEADNDEPFGSRVARKTESTTKFFRKKSKDSTTTAAPRKKTEASQQKTAGTSKNNATEAESTSTTQPKSDNDKQFEAGRSISEKSAPNQPIANKSSGVANQGSITTITVATNQPTVTRYIYDANQSPKTGFTADETPINGFTNIANQPYTSTFTSGNVQSTADSVAENKNGNNSKSYDKLSNKPTDSVTKNKDRRNSKAKNPIAKRGKDQSDTKAAVPVFSGQNKSDAEATFSKRQSSETTQSEQTFSDQATVSSILNGITTTKSEVDVKTITPLPTKKPTVSSKINGAPKIDELIKARQARLTTRSEALAALRKENENRRAKKMIEASLKLLESESARFAEYEKRRRDQLDKLKDKLRAKREKMLSQYKEELIEAINESDQKHSNLRRRDLIDGYSRTDEESGFTNDSPITEMRALHDNLDTRQTLNQPMEDEEEMYDMSTSEFKSINFKRSPMVVTELNNRNNQPQIMEGDSGEYYTPEQQQLLEQRVLEVQKRLQQQRQQQQLHTRQRRDELLKQQEELQDREKQAGAQEQYPQVQQAYPPQVQQPYPTYVQQPYPQQMQQPYPPHVQQPYAAQARQPYAAQAQQIYPMQAQQPYAAQVQQAYQAQAQQAYPGQVLQLYAGQVPKTSYPTQVQQPYPPTAITPQSHLPGQHQQQQRHPAQHYPQTQGNGKNTVPVNVQYNQPPQAVPQQQSVYPQLTASSPQPSVSSPTATQEQTDSEPQVSETAITQQPNAALYNQQSSSQPQQPGANYYKQDPATTTEQHAASYYNHTPAAAASYYNYTQQQKQQQQPQQQSNDGYANKQTSVPQKAQHQQHTADYYNQPAAAGQQYYYPPASPAADYYKQLSTASQQPIEINNNKNLESTLQATTVANEQPAVPQKTSNAQSSVPYQQTNVEANYGQQSSLPNTSTNQSKQTAAVQERSDARLYQQNVENLESLQQLKVYQPVPTAEEPLTSYDANSYSQYYRDLSQQEPEVNQYEMSPATYEGMQQGSTPGGYKKSKRSNLKVLEINPSIYDDDESDYNLHELFMKPAYRFSSRSYRSYPSDNKRYRRGVELNDEEDGPLSISLGLDLSNMLPRENNHASTDTFVRRKRQVEDSNAFQGRSPLNKNVKKIFKLEHDDKHKKTPKKITVLRRVDDTEIDDDIPKVRKLRRVDDVVNYSPSVDDFDNNDLDNNKGKDALLTRRKRSPNPKYEHHLKYNHIDRNEDNDINEIWNDIIEMKHDEALDEYDRRKNELFSNFIKEQKPEDLSINDNEDSTIQKVAESTTKANIESMIVEAIPKLENVITGGIEKAQNLTGNFENLIENFDEQVDETTKNPQEISVTQEDINGRLSHGVFKTVIGSVKKFFGFISGFSKIFHNH